MTRYMLLKQFVMQSKFSILERIFEKSYGTISLDAILPSSLDFVHEKLAVPCHALKSPAF